MSEHRHEHDHSHAERPAVERIADVAVVGGSAAGLAGALQLGRADRRVIVVDDGRPRNAPAAHMHGYLGHEGLPPSELLAIGREEVRSYGGEVLPGRVVAAGRADDGRLRLQLAGGNSVLARRLLIATGLVDELPDIDGVADHWGRDVIHCPFCHGYEVRGRRLVQIVTSPMALHPAVMFRHLSPNLTLVLHDGVASDDPALDQFRAGGVDVVDRQVARLVDGDDGRLAAVELVDGTRLAADAVVVSTRMHPRLEPFSSIGLEATPHPAGFGELLEVDPTGRTAVEGVFAAGNVTDPSLQVLGSAAAGSWTGAMISADLAAEDLAGDARPDASESDWDHRYSGERLWSGNPNGTLVAEVAHLRPGTALDVGAGEGGDAVWLAEQGWDVTANDISGRALGRIEDAARERGLEVSVLRADANDLGAFGSAEFDLVSAQYASLHRTPDGRGIDNLLRVVAPGGTLLVVGHDLTPMHTPIDPSENSRPFDPDAYVRVDDVASAIAESPEWDVEVHETRPRPPGASSSHHVDDVVLRARRRP